PPCGRTGARPRSTAPSGRRRACCRARRSGRGSRAAWPGESAPRPARRAPRRVPADRSPATGSTLTKNEHGPGTLKDEPRRTRRTRIFMLLESAPRVAVTRNKTISSCSSCSSWFIFFFVVHLLSASAAATPARAPDAHAEPKWRAAGRLRTDDVLDALVVVKERPAARGAEAAARAARGHRHVARSGGRLVE